MFSKITEQNIAGIITTNYDSFIENNTKGYKKYVGQKELIFSAIQGVAEIFKIHGSIEEPESLVINEKDYINFEEKCPYLAAKLMTIFVEYPIVFMGYSISDVNIQNIIKSMMDCLDEQQIKLLKDRFMFVEYSTEEKIEILPFSIMIENKSLEMTRIVVKDFRMIFKALEGNKSKIPVRILRRFKQDLYDFIVKNEAKDTMQVADLNDQRVSDDELVLSIGTRKVYGVKGLNGLTADEWYRNIVLNDVSFTADELLSYAYKDLAKQNSYRLPVFKYLYEANGKYIECEKFAESLSFDSMISNTIRKNRKNMLKSYKSVNEIWSAEKESYDKATSLIAHLPEENINVCELESVLKEIFILNPNILKHQKKSIGTNVRRLIRIYDYLKWSNKKEPLD